MLWQPANIFLCENDLLKIGDLGIAKALTSMNYAKTQIGTPCYMAPEVRYAPSAGARHPGPAAGRQAPRLDTTVASCQGHTQRKRGGLLASVVQAVAVPACTREAPTLLARAEL